MQIISAEWLLLSGTAVQFLGGWKSLFIDCGGAKHTGLLPPPKAAVSAALFYQILKFKAICFDSYFYVFGLLFFRESITVKIVIGGALVIISAPWQYCSKQKENEDESNKYTTW